MFKKKFFQNSLYPVQIPPKADYYFFIFYVENLREANKQEGCNKRTETIH